MNYYLSTQYHEYSKQPKVCGIKIGKPIPTIDLISNKYFLYRHIRIDTNEVFYIGIGTKRSALNYDRAYSNKNRNKWWNNIVNKTGFKVDILIESDNRDFIINKEKEFIKLYGRKDLNKGSLCNLTDGGEGAINVIVSEETREKHSEIFKGNKFRLGTHHSEETKKLMSLQRKGVKRKPFSEESKIRCRNAQLGSIKSEETKEKHRQRAKLPNQCNKKKTILIDTKTNEKWEAESRIKLASICPISIGTIKKLLNNKNVCNNYKKYKIL